MNVSPVQCLRPNQVLGSQYCAQLERQSSFGYDTSLKPATTKWRSKV